MIKKFFMFISFFCIISFGFAKSQIVVGVENEAPRLNPLYDESHDSALSLIFSGLTSHDKNSKIIPGLASAWKVSKDGLVYTFDLRKDAYWHDGVKFTAKDVLFTINAAKDKSLNAPAYTNYEMVNKVDILDDYKIKITLREPFPPFLDVLSLGVIPEHILKGKNIAESDFNNKPIGTGPYKVIEWKKGQSIELVADKKFYKGAPKIDKIFLKTIPDAQVRLIQLKSGEVDVALIDPSSVKFAKKSKNLNVIRFDSADYRALMFNMKNKLFADPNVRIALNLLVDKETIVKKTLHGYGSVAYNPIQKSFANSDDFKFKYNPKKAHELLKKSGWAKNKDGIYEKNGKKLSFDIYAFNSDPTRVTLAKILSSEFKKNGIVSNAYAKPSTAFDLDKVDSFVIGWGSPFDPDFHTYLVFGGFADIDKNENGWNYSHYNNPKVDDALKKARFTQDVNGRKAHYRDFIEQLHLDPAYIFIAYLNFPLVHNVKVQNIQPIVLGHHGGKFLSHAYEWKLAD